MKLIDWHNIDFGHCKRYVLINGTPYVDLNEIAEKLKNIPMADVAPVVHGKWLTDTQEVDGCIKCSVCGLELDKYIIGGDMPEYCLCGAKMDLE